MPYPRMPIFLALANLVMYGAKRLVHVVHSAPALPNTASSADSTGWMFHTYSGMPASVMSPQPLATWVALNAAKVSLRGW